MIRIITQAGALLTQAGANVRSRFDEWKRDHADRHSIIPFIDQAREALEAEAGALTYRFPAADFSHDVVRRLAAGAVQHGRVSIGPDGPSLVQHGRVRLARAESQIVQHGHVRTSSMLEHACGKPVEIK